MHDDDDDLDDNGNDDDDDYVLCAKRRTRTHESTALINGFHLNGHSPGRVHKR